MAIAMKLRYTDPVVDNSLKNYYADGKKMGYQFDIRLACYRGHFLSLINKISLRVDGKEIEKQDMVFVLHDKEFGISQLKDASTEFWPIIDPATIKVYMPGGLEAGEHEIDFFMEYRCPYMPIGDREYMPWDSSCCKVLKIN